jgi:putative phosphoesterase
MRIAVISDTHNYLDPAVPQLFAGVEHILHAGDIGLPWLLLELGQIAPVTAVSGNTDDPGLHYRRTESVELAGRRILLHHILDPHSRNDPFHERIKREKPGIVVFGHTHKPFCEERAGVLFLNPGYAGKSRFGLPRSVALLHCDHGSLRAEHLPLP